MKKGSFCDIVNVNKEKQSDITLTWGTSQDIHLYEDLNFPILVHCILLFKTIEWVDSLFQTIAYTFKCL